jgi:hypothetical protein
MYCAGPARNQCPPPHADTCTPTANNCSGDGGGDGGGTDPGSGGGGTGGGPSEPPSEFPELHNGTVEGSVFLSYDNCKYKAKDKVYAVVEVDLSGADLSLGGKLKVKMSVSRYDYRRQSTIKRSGAGKYKGALFLAAPPYANNYRVGAKTAVTINRYKGKKVGIAPLTAVDYVSYSPAGGSLLRCPAAKQLKGGKATIEVRYGAEGYAQCYALSPRDQFAGGYPKVSR